MSRPYIAVVLVVAVSLLPMLRAAATGRGLATARACAATGAIVALTIAVQSFLFDWRASDLSQLNPLEMGPTQLEISVNGLRASTAGLAASLYYFLVGVAFYLGLEAAAWVRRSRAR